MEQLDLFIPNVEKVEVYSPLTPFTLASNIVYSPSITIVTALAQGCTHCQELKKHLPDIEKYANERGMTMYYIDVIEENKDFFEKYQNETLPYTFIFDNAEFVGGDSFNKDTLVELINVLSAKMEGKNVVIS